MEREPWFWIVVGWLKDYPPPLIEIMLDYIYEPKYAGFVDLKMICEQVLSCHCEGRHSAECPFYDRCDKCGCLRKEYGDSSYHTYNCENVKSLSSFLPEKMYPMAKILRDIGFQNESISAIMEYYCTDNLTDFRISETIQKIRNVVIETSKCHCLSEKQDTYTSVCHFPLKEENCHIGCCFENMCLECGGKKSATSYGTSYHSYDCKYAKKCEYCKVRVDMIYQVDHGYGCKFRNSGMNDKFRRHEYEAFDFGSLYPTIHIIQSSALYDYIYENYNDVIVKERTHKPRRSKKHYHQIPSKHNQKRRPQKKSQRHHQPFPKTRRRRGC
jgi:hypothetical protein